MSLDNRVMDKLEVYHRLAGFDYDEATYDDEARYISRRNDFLTKKIIFGNEQQRCVKTRKRAVAEFFDSL